MSGRNVEQQLETRACNKDVSSENGSQDIDTHEGALAEPQHYFAKWRENLSVDIDLLSHVRTEHKVCQQKDESLSQIQLSRLNSINESNKEETLNQTSVCDDNDGSIQCLIDSAHIDTEKSALGCALCGAQYTSTYDLNRHRCDALDEKLKEDTDLTCPVCQRNYYSKRGWQKHLNIHLGQEKHQCLSCGDRFSELRELKKHVNIHKDDHPFGCLLCPQVFKSESGLEQHVEVHDNSKNVSPRKESHRVMQKRGRITFSCAECGKCFRHNIGLLMHVHVAHGSKGEVEHKKSSCCDDHDDTLCQSVGKGTKPVTEESALLACALCGEKFLIRHDLNHHCCDKLDKNVLDRSNPMCPVCDKRFFDIHVFKNHMSLHLGEGRHQCRMCGVQFSYSIQLKRHEKQHERDLPFKCDRCPMRFYTQSLLDQHKKIHHCKEHSVIQHKKSHPSDKQRSANRDEFLAINQSEKCPAKYECEKCGENFAHNTKLNKHMQRKHNANTRKEEVQKRPANRYERHTGKNSPKTLKSNDGKSSGRDLSCALCNDRFSSPYDINRHKCEALGKKMQEGVLETCPVCQKQFSTARSCSRHMNIHLNQQKFQCSICGHRFSDKRDYFRHRLKVHNMDFPFKCSQCLGGFSSEVGCKWHKARCIQSFRRKPGPKKQHRKLSTPAVEIPEGSSPFKCEICMKEFHSKGKFDQHRIKKICKKTLSRFEDHVSSHPHMCSVCSKRFKFKASLRHHQKVEHLSSKAPQIGMPTLRIPMLELVEDMIDQEINSPSVHLENNDSSKEPIPVLVEEATKEEWQLSPLLSMYIKTEPSSEPMPEFASEITVQNASAPSLLCESDQTLSNSLPELIQEDWPEVMHSQSSTIPVKEGEENRREEGLFECFLCDKKLKTEEKLKSHLRVHTGVKPHACMVCSKRFNFPSTLKIHMKSHTKYSGNSV